MPTGLRRFHQSGTYHAINFSCYHRKPYLTDPGAYQTFLEVLEQARKRHSLLVYGYALMPEHVHLLVNEPPKTPLATVLRVLKQETSSKLKASRTAFWQDRYYDFNVYSVEKFQEKLRYTHRNPVVRGLVAKPEDWPWSSFNHYLTGIPGTVEIESWWTQQARTKQVKRIDPTHPGPAHQ